MLVKSGDLIVTSKGRRFRVVSYKRHDDQSDTFRLKALDDGVIGNKRWTADMLGRAGKDCYDGS